MKRRLCKGLAAAVTAVLCILPLCACGSSQESWEGTYYQEIDKTHFYVFEITMNSEGEDSASVFISRLDCEIHEDGSYGIAGGGWSAYLEKDGSGDDGNYVYKLRGDTLTVTAADKEDDYAVLFEGKYTRGEPLPRDDAESGEDEGEDEDYGGEYGELRYDVDYLLNGEQDSLELYFYEDETVLISDPDWSDFVPFAVEGGYVGIDISEIGQLNGEVLVLQILGDGTLLAEDGSVFIMEE